MRRVLWLLLAGAVAIGFAWFLAGLPGGVALEIGGLTIETSAGLGALGTLLFLVVLVLVLRLVLGVLGVPRRLRAWRARRRRARGDAAVGRALVALAAADPDAARRESRRAREALGDGAQTLLLAAESERLAGRDGAAEAIYRDMAGREDAAFLGLRGLFRQAIARDDWDGAAALAKRAEAAYPGAAWLREERTMLAVRTGDWNQALALAGPDAPRAAYATAIAEAAVDPERGLALARKAWKDDRGFVPAALAYAARLRKAGREKAAQSVLAESWTEAPHPALAALALAPVTDGLARVAAATKLVAGAPDHAESHFLLARENFAAGLPGEARRHAEAARRAGLRQRRLHLLLGELEAAEGHADAQRDALLDAANAEPDPAWRCEACGAVHERWHAACPACHTPGRIVWGGPPRLAITAG